MAKRWRNSRHPLFASGIAPSHRTGFIHNAAPYQKVTRRKNNIIQLWKFTLLFYQKYGSLQAIFFHFMEVYISLQLKNKLLWKHRPYSAS